MTIALAVGGFALSLAPAGAIGPPWVLALLVIASYAWVLRAPTNARRDDVLPALAVLVSALGLATVARLSSDLAHRQEIWLLVSLGLATALGPAFDTFRRFAAFKYVWVLGSVVLFAFVAVFGQEVNGAKLWIRVGPIQYEPVELIKLFIVLFMAGYLAETADVLAAARAWSIRSNLKYLGPLFVGWATSMGILVFERDIGMASLLLATFAAMLYVATRRIDLIVGGGIAFALAMWAAVKHYPYVIARFDAWRDPFADPLGHGYQALQGLFSLAAGGLLGTGYGLGHPGYIPEASTDYIYAAWSEEFGVFGGAILIGVFLLVLVRALGVARAQPDLYAKLLATGLAATLGFQVFIIIGGVIGLFPLTGITLPFFSYGGSSLVANFLLVALVWAISSERLPTRQMAKT